MDIKERGMAIENLNIAFSRCEQSGVGISHLYLLLLTSTVPLVRNTIDTMFISEDTENYKKHAYNYFKLIKILTNMLEIDVQLLENIGYTLDTERKVIAYIRELEKKNE